MYTHSRLRYSRERGSACLRVIVSPTIDGYALHDDDDCNDNDDHDHHEMMATRVRERGRESTDTSTHTHTNNQAMQVSLPLFSRWKQQLIRSMTIFAHTHTCTHNTRTLLLRLLHSKAARSSHTCMQADAGTSTQRQEDVRQASHDGTATTTTGIRAD